METNTKSGDYRLNQTIIRFPDIQLKTRDGHKLRGFFGNLFREHSPLLHNHFEDGTHRYAYPLVQYKVIDKVPMLTGFQEGSELLIDLFLKIKELVIDDTLYPVYSKNIENKTVVFDDFDTLKTYNLKTLWLGLNQKNHKIYRQMDSPDEKRKFLDRILRNNILSFYKGVNYWTEEKIMVTANLKSKTTHLKGIEMMGFTGTFVTNAILPDFAGLGKSVSRGFGTVLKQ